MKNRILYTMRDFMERGLHVVIDDEGMVCSVDGQDIEPTPLEDYGDYVLTKQPVKDAFGQWVAWMDQQE